MLLKIELDSKFYNKIIHKLLSRYLNIHEMSVIYNKLDINL